MNRNNNFATYVQLDLPASHKYLNVLGACVKALLERVTGISEPNSISYNVELAVHETCANIVEHAYGDANGRILVKLTVNEEPRQLVVDVHDTGRAFDLSQIPEPSLEGVQTRGYGLFLVRELVDEVTYYPKEGNNRWRLVKKI